MRMIEVVARDCRGWLTSRADRRAAGCDHHSPNMPTMRVGERRGSSQRPPNWRVPNTVSDALPAPAFEVRPRAGETLGNFNFRIVPMMDNADVTVPAASHT
jgi:hypothetical protein